MSGAGRAALLVGFWLLAWGEVSVANVASGLLVAAALLVAFPPRKRAPQANRVRPLAVARLVLYVLGQLVPSNVLVAREVLARRSHIRAGVLAYPLQHPSDEALSLMAHVIALTPGTMTVEATQEPGVIYVHFLLLDDLEVARGALRHLERLVVDALGGPGPGAAPTAIGGAG